jgi:hypothetical protein
MSVGHCVPSGPADCVILRKRDFVPPPHALLHASQSVQDDTVQFSALSGGSHACALQTCDSIKAPQLAPPCAAGMVTPRVRYSTPPSHSSEQTPQSLQAPAMQATGHSCTLQGVDSSRSGHATPPFADGVVTPRVRVWVPVPHVVVQALGAPQADTTQSTAQATAPQGSLWVVLGQTTPPPEAAVVIPR